MLAAAQKVFDEVNCSGKSLPSTSDHTSYLDEDAESMRWFLLPNEAEKVLLGVATPTVTPPFRPRLYPTHEGCSATSDSAGDTAKTSPNETTSREGDSQDTGIANSVAEDCGSSAKEEGVRQLVKFHCPPRSIYKPMTEVCVRMYWPHLKAHLSRLVNVPP